MTILPSMPPAARKRIDASVLFGMQTTGALRVTYSAASPAQPATAANAETINVRRPTATILATDGVSHYAIGGPLASVEKATGPITFR